MFPNPKESFMTQPPQPLAPKAASIRRVANGAPRQCQACVRPNVALNSVSLKVGFHVCSPPLKGQQSLEGPCLLGALYCSFGIQSCKNFLLDQFAIYLCSPYPKPQTASNEEPFGRLLTLGWKPMLPSSCLFAS